LTKQQLTLGGSVAAALVLVVALLVWKPWQPAPPRLNAEPVEIARFAASNALNGQPWSMQREYMEVLDEKEDALLEGYKNGALTDQQYRRALQLGWYGKHLDRMDKFFRLNPVQRAFFLDDKVLDKRDVNPGLPKKKDPKKSESTAALNPEEVERDDSNEEQDIARWPADVRQKWDAYRAAVRARKDFHQERYEKAQAAAKEGKPAATAPAAPDAPQPAAGAAPSDVD
jgi:hypothetical protein